MLVIGGVVVLATRRLFVPRVRATTAPIDYVTLILLLIVILTGIAPTIGVNLFGHGYDYRTTVAPWFRGLFSFAPGHASHRARAVHLPTARDRRLGDLGRCGRSAAWCTPGATRCGTCGGPTSSTAAARAGPPERARHRRTQVAQDRCPLLTAPGHRCHRCGGWVREAVRTLNPGYFALVMATGIVSVALQSHHQHLLALRHAAVARRHRVCGAG